MPRNRRRKSAEEVSLRKLIRVETERRDFQMVETLFNKLGQLFQEQERENGSLPA